MRRTLIGLSTFVLAIGFTSQVRASSPPPAEAAAGPVCYIQNVYENGGRCTYKVCDGNAELMYCEP
jgi:hypothetical protein